MLWTIIPLTWYPDGLKCWRNSATEPYHTFSLSRGSKLDHQFGQCVGDLELPNCPILSAKTSCTVQLCRSPNLRVRAAVGQHGMIITVRLPDFSCMFMTALNQCNRKWSVIHSLSRCIAHIIDNEGLNGSSALRVDMGMMKLNLQGQKPGQGQYPPNLNGNSGWAYQQQQQQQQRQPRHSFEGDHNFRYKPWCMPCHANPDKIS